MNLSRRPGQEAAEQASPTSSPTGASLARGMGGDEPAKGGRDRIASHGLFEGVPHADLEPLVEGCEMRALGADELLLAPGSMNRNLYLLLDGQLRVHVDRIDSAEYFLIGPGEYTGEISVIDARAPSAFVVADRPCQILIVSESVFWKRLMPVPAIAKNFMRLFASRLRARTEAMQRTLVQQLRYEHLQRELAIARDIQLDMLPRDLNPGPEIEIAAGMIPAQEVSGDFYDAFPLGDREYCVAIGDISGKGVPAALFMVRTMTLLRSEMLKGRPIDEALAALNGLLCEENSRCMFATLVVGILDRPTGDFRYVVGGHEAVILGEGGSGFRFLDPPRGIMIGVHPGAEYQVARLTLNRGDVLVLYTDGVTEAMDESGAVFSSKRLLGCLSGPAAAPARLVARRIRGAVQAFSGGAAGSDDLTTLVLRYLGPETGP